MTTERSLSRAASIRSPRFGAKARASFTTRSALSRGIAACGARGAAAADASLISSRQIFPCAGRFLAIQPMKRNKFANDLKCSNCGQLGSAVWEENVMPRKSGIQSQIVALYGNFHIEAARIGIIGQVIVCTTCDEIQPD